MTLVVDLCILGSWVQVGSNKKEKNMELKHGYMIAVPTRKGFKSPQATLFRSKSEAISNYLKSNGIRVSKLSRRERDRIWKTFRRNGICAMSVAAVPK